MSYHVLQGIGYHVLKGVGSKEVVTRSLVGYQGGRGGIKYWVTYHPLDHTPLQDIVNEACGKLS